LIEYYRTSSAPFLATRCLAEIVRQHHLEHPVAAEVISRNFYVDDLLTSRDNVQELLELQRDIIQTLNVQTAKLELRKWRSNAPKLHTQMIDIDSTMTIRKEAMTLELL